MSAATVLVFAVAVILVPLALNEAGELAPWLAGQIVRRAAAFLGSPEARARYEEEWLANLERVPGKITKVAWAFGLLAWAVPHMRWQISSRRRRAARSALPVVELRQTVRREVEVVVRSLLSAKGHSAGTTTALYGGGGFGKTSVAQLVCADMRVRRRFGERIYWVALGGEQRSTSQIAATVSQATMLIAGVSTQFADPQLAGAHLGSLLCDMRRPVLLVLDDVWDAAQLAPFLIGAPNCARLVTTRVMQALPSDAKTVRIDQMEPALAAALLTQGLPAMPADLVDRLVAACGGWALLLRLANRRLAEQAATSGDIAGNAQALLRLLGADPTALDRPSTMSDLADPHQRSNLVAASVLASLNMLPPKVVDRFWELGAFPSDEPLPVRVLARLWMKVAGLSEAETRRICVDLQRFALIELDSADGGVVLLHDVVRGYARIQLGQARAQRVNQQLTFPQVAGGSKSCGD